MKIFKTSNQLRLLYFLYYAAGVSWVPIFSNYLNQNQLSGIKIGILSGINPLIMLFIQPVWGFLADKIGRKWLLLVATFLVAVCFLLYNCPMTFGHILFLTIAVAVFWSTVSPLVDVIVLDHVEETKGSYSEFRMWGAIGWSTASWVMSFYVVNNDYVIYFRIAATILFVCAFILIWLFPPKPLSKIDEISFTRQGFKHTFANRSIILFFIIIFVHGITTTSIWNYEGLLLEKMGASQKILRWTFGFQGIFEIPFFFFADRIIKRFTIEKTLFVAFSASVIRMLLYGLIQTPISILFVDILHGLSWSMFWVCCVEYVNQKIAPEWRATGQSFLWAVYLGGGYIVGNLLTGYWLDIMKIQHIFIIDAAILFIFTILLIPAAFRKTKAVTNPLNLD